MRVLEQSPEHLCQERDRLKQERDRLTQELATAQRARKRQAAPFFKGQPKSTPSATRPEGRAQVRAEAAPEGPGAGGQRGRCAAAGGLPDVSRGDRARAGRGPRPGRDRPARPRDAVSGPHRPLCRVRHPSPRPASQPDVGGDRGSGRAGRPRGPGLRGDLEPGVRTQPSVTLDETGWRIGGHPAWLHVAATADATVYGIFAGRGVDAAAALIGADYDGCLVRDGWAPYRRCEAAYHQTCTQHLINRCDALIRQATPAGAGFPEQIKAILQQGLRLRDRYAAGTGSVHGLAVATGRLEAQLARVLDRRSRLPDHRRLAHHLSRECDALFTYLRCPGLEATNYRGVVEHTLSGSESEPAPSATGDGALQRRPRLPSLPSHLEKPDRAVCRLATRKHARLVGSARGSDICNCLAGPKPQKQGLRQRRLDKTLRLGYRSGSAGLA